MFTVFIAVKQIGTNTPYIAVIYVGFCLAADVDKLDIDNIFNPVCRKGDICCNGCVKVKDTAVFVKPARQSVTVFLTGI